MSTPTPSEVAKGIGDLLRLLPLKWRARAYAVLGPLSIVLGALAIGLQALGDTTIHGVRPADFAPYVLVVSGIAHLVAKANAS